MGTMIAPVQHPSMVVSPPWSCAETVAFYCLLAIACVIVFALARNALK